MNEENNPVAECIEDMLRVASGTIANLVDAKVRAGDLSEDQGNDVIEHFEEEWGFTIDYPIQDPEEVAA